MIWRAFVVLSLLLVAGLTVFLGRGGTNSGPAESSPDPPQPGYFMKDAVIVEMGPDGKPRYRMSAAGIAQNPIDLSVRLEKMKLVYRAQGEHEWTLTADTGFVPPQSRTIDLAGDVQVHGLPSQGAAPAVLKTERLRLDTQANIATTRDRVDIAWGNRSISSMGLKADLNEQRLQLESAVHGRFVPQ